MRQIPNHLGLYRQWGFQKNIFQFFHTPNPAAHFETIKPDLKILEDSTVCEITEMLGLNIPKTFVKYTTKSYTNYSYMHYKLTNILQNENIITHNQCTNIFGISKSIIYIKDQDLHRIDLNLDEYFEELMQFNKNWY